MTTDLSGLKAKVNYYKEVLNNTVSFREEWHKSLKNHIKEYLNEIITSTELKAEIKVNEKVENLESIVLDLGRASSGISENIEDSGIKRIMVKSNGALIYQQLFNGKVMVMILSPYIEGYGEPKAPRTLEILKPAEVRPQLIVRHVELLLKDITDWEDYDDGEPHKTPIGFQPIGFNREELEA